jgi:hypothetical protein
MGVGSQRHIPAPLPPVKDQLPIVRKSGWVLGPVWTGAENLAPTRIRFSDRPVRSQSQYRLNYPSQHSGPGVFKRHYLQNIYKRDFREHQETIKA